MIDERRHDPRSPPGIVEKENGETDWHFPDRKQWQIQRSPAFCSEENDIMTMQSRRRRQLHNPTDIRVAPWRGHVVITSRASSSNDKKKSSWWGCGLHLTALEEPLAMPLPAYPQDNFLYVFLQVRVFLRGMSYQNMETERCFFFSCLMAVH